MITLNIYQLVGFIYYIYQLHSSMRIIYVFIYLFIYVAILFFLCAFSLAYFLSLHCVVLAYILILYKVSLHYKLSPRKWFTIVNI